MVFEHVKKGDIIARSGNKEQRAMFDFIPVLVNEDAYEGVLCLACKRMSAEGFGRQINVFLKNLPNL
ncbi:MAG: hypothetical protein AABX54_02265 [Nanoarchaeota archaeon]